MAKLQALLSEMPPKPAHLFKPTDITRLLNTIANLVDKISEVQSRQQVPLSAIPDMQQKMVMVIVDVLSKRYGVEEAKEAAQEMAEQWRMIQGEF